MRSRSTSSTRHSRPLLSRAGALDIVPKLPRAVFGYAKTHPNQGLQPRLTGRRSQRLESVKRRKRLLAVTAMNPAARRSRRRPQRLDHAVADSAAFVPTKEL